MLNSMIQDQDKAYHLLEGQEFKNIYYKLVPNRLMKCYKFYQRQLILLNQQDNKLFMLSILKG